MTRRLPVLTELYLEEGERPRTREDCGLVPRPCPFVACRHNNYLEARGNRVELTWPGVEPEDVPPARSCSLDIADGGESTLEDIAAVVELTRERVRQIEAKAIEAIRGRRGRTLSELANDGRTIDKGRSAGRSRAFEEVRESQELPAERRRDDDDRTAGMKVSFFAEDESAEELVCNMVWRIFAKDSTARGFDARSANSKRASAWRRKNPAKGMQPFAVVNARKKANKAG